MKITDGPLQPSTNKAQPTLTSGRIRLREFLHYQAVCIQDVQFSAEITKHANSHGREAQSVGALSHIPKGCRFVPGQDTYLGCRFDPQLGHVWRQPIKFLSHIRASFSLSLSTFLSLESMNISSGENKKKKNMKPWLVWLSGLSAGL